MTLENHIPDIQEKLKKNEYPNEQSISQRASGTPFTFTGLKL